ncbi:hypothetical protein PROFUN_03850 [Planoprotostelium fungivorum]|uniref:Uncharacterized protein n=1 Tax=Planoprotostelium fungivorum TaxID=1890364 RepID=A0A2P6NIB4_9EUKA|nr:hypothetical protein PROFUN_03850 [Planoprotostelium fungivorum]
MLHALLVLLSIVKISVAEDSSASYMIVQQYGTSNCTNSTIISTTYYPLNVCLSNADATISNFHVCDDGAPVTYVFQSSCDSTPDNVYVRPKGCVRSVRYGCVNELPSGTGMMVSTSYQKKDCTGDLLNVIYRESTDCKSSSTCKDGTKTVCRASDSIMISPFYLLTLIFTLAASLFRSNLGLVVHG